MPSAGGAPKALADRILEASLEELLGTAPGDRNMGDRNMGEAIRAGLLLRADWLDASHTVSQGIDTAEGSYWHGIMHRREPDYGNSKYWFRRTGPHPLFQRLAEPADTSGDAFDEIVTAGEWDPFSFVDLCEACDGGSRPELRDELETLQEREIILLLAHCFEAAT